MAATSTTTRPNEGIATAFLALCLGAAAMGVSPIFVRFAAADVNQDGRLKKEEAKAGMPNV